MKSKLLFIFTILITVSINAQTRTSEYSEEILTVPETWRMGSQKYNIEATSILEGSVFIVKVLWDETPTEEHREHAINVAQFALVKGYRNNAKSLRFVNQFAEVSMDHIGVALINKNELGDTGYRFMFNTEEVLGKEFKEGIISDPKYLEKEKDISELGLEIWAYLKSNDNDKLVEKFDTQLLQLYSEDDLKKLLTQLSTISNKSEFVEFSHKIFLGNAYGGRLFNYFYWLKDDKNNGFLKLSLIDKNDKYTLVGINIDINSFIKK